MSLNMQLICLRCYHLWSTWRKGNNLLLHIMWQQWSKNKTEKSGELCESGVVARFCLWTVDDRRGGFLSIQLTQDGNTQRNGQYLKDGDSYCFIPCLYFDLNVAAILKRRLRGGRKTILWHILCLTCVTAGKAQVFWIRWMMAEFH